MAEVVRRSLDDRLASLSRGAPRSSRPGRRRTALRHHRSRGPRRHPLGDASRFARQHVHPGRVASRWVRSRRGGAATPRLGGFRRRPAGRSRRGGGRGGGDRVAACHGHRRCATVDDRGDARLATSTCCTSPRTAGTRPTTRCSPVSSSQTARCSATTSIGCRACPPTVVLSACEVGPFFRALGRGGRRDDARLAARRHALRDRGARGRRRRCRVRAARRDA